MARRDPEERTRRRFLRRQWARRWRLWRMVVVAVLLVAAVAGGVYTLYFSDVFAVEGARVEGNSTLSTQEVLARAAVPTGGSLATVDLLSIERRVASLAAVREVHVSRSWPHQVRIDVAEREPVAVVETAGTLRAVDADGVLFTRYAKAPPDLPRIVLDGPPAADALREASAVVAALPDGVATVTDHLELAGADDVRLALSDGLQVRWGSADESAQKGEVLLALLQQTRADYFDVSVPGNPATRPEPPAT